MMRVRLVRDLVAALTVALALFAMAGEAWDRAFYEMPRLKAAGGVAVTTPLMSPSAQASVTGGDNNGFELNPTNAFADDGVMAQDVNSGTNSNNSCLFGGGPDRHNFYNYGLTPRIPTGSTISDITVRADLAVDAVVDSPRTCVKLSWNAGTNLTTGQTIALTATTETTYTYTTADSGHTFTTAELSNANFRVHLRNLDNNGGASNRDFSLDWAPVQVTYTAPWDSYDSGCGTVTDTFSDGSNSFVCGKGTGFETTAGLYNAGFYDGGGTLRFSDNGLTAAGGTLTTPDHKLSGNPGWTAGTWHVVALRSTALPAAYSAIDTAAEQAANNVIADDTFTVNASALPEFPSPLVALVAAALSAGGYLWLRRRAVRGSAQI